MLICYKANIKFESREILKTEDGGQIAIDWVLDDTI